MKKTAAAIALALAIAGCGGGTDTEVPATSTSPLTPFNNVVNQADDVADAVDQRTADIENQLNN